MKKGKTQNKTIILILVLVAIVVGGFFLRSHIDRNVIEKEILQRSILKSKDKGNIVIVKRKIEELANQLGEVNSYLIDSTKNIEFIEGVEALGEELNLDMTVRNIKTEEVTAKKREIKDDGSQNIKEVRSHGILSMDIFAIGTWNDVMQLLLLFENYPQYLIITDVRLTANSGDSNDWSLTLQLQGLTN